MDKQKIAFEMKKLLDEKGDKLIYTKEEVIDLMLDSIAIGRNSLADEMRGTVNALRDGLSNLSYQNFKSKNKS